MKKAAVPEFKTKFLQVYNTGDDAKLFEYLNEAINNGDLRKLANHPIKEFCQVIRNIANSGLTELCEKVLPIVFNENPISIINIFSGVEVSVEVQSMIIGTSRPYFIRWIKNQNEELMCLYVQQYHKAILGINKITPKIFNAFVEAFPQYGYQVVNIIKHHTRPTYFFDNKGFMRLWRAYVKKQASV